MDKKFVNVLLLGFGFMFLFTAFQTMGNIEVNTLFARRDETLEPSWKCITIYENYFVKNLFKIDRKLRFRLYFWSSKFILFFFSIVSKKSDSVNCPKKYFLMKKNSSTKIDVLPVIFQSNISRCFLFFFIRNKIRCIAYKLLYLFRVKIRRNNFKCIYCSKSVVTCLSFLRFRSKRMVMWLSKQNDKSVLSKNGQRQQKM